MSDLPTPETDLLYLKQRPSIVQMTTHFNQFVKKCQQLERERDELIERNAKLRDIAERAIEMKEQEVWGTGELPFSWKQLRAELDQLKECGK
ncbi:MAG: hypothetical protein RL078_54 [Bacteroidota bacterium]